MMASGIHVLGPRPQLFDSDTFDGIGADLRIAFSGDHDEGDRRMRDLIERMRQIEARPDAPARG